MKKINKSTKTPPSGGGGLIDILIIGSGPIGSTYARLLNEEKPEAKILMVDLGPRLTEKTGQHFKNIPNEIERELVQIKSQGNHQKAYPMISVAERAIAAQKGHLSLDMLARPGTHLVTDNLKDLTENQLPAASLSSNVGGMGAHWTCACPRPGNGERIPFIPKKEMDSLLDKAEELLYVSQNTFPETPEGLAILKVLGGVFNENASLDRQVQKMPLACKVENDGTKYWTGTDLILGKLSEPNYQGNFEIRSETICRKLIFSDDKSSDIEHRVTGAILENLVSGEQEEITAKIVIVAADAMRTPQLLWASNIRPKALGHYLNEHTFIFSFAEIAPPPPMGEQKSDTKAPPLGAGGAGIIGVFWVPFDAPNHPFHGQVMHMDVSPIQIETHGNSKHIVGLGWGTLKELRYEDHIVFSETETDYLGMPKMNFKFSLTEKDKKNIENAFKMQEKALSAFGKLIKEGEQTLMPAGTSLHYEGTTRMGLLNDGTSVCDEYSKVWGFENLFVGGNGVIPTSTTSNPTLTSVALAIRACEKIIENW
jgi:choline dehydrogenase-like flavoprotein